MAYPKSCSPADFNAQFTDWVDRANARVVTVVSVDVGDVEVAVGQVGDIDGAGTLGFHQGLKGVQLAAVEQPCQPARPPLRQVRRDASA